MAKPYAGQILYGNFFAKKDANFRNDLDGQFICTVILTLLGTWHISTNLENDYKKHVL